MRFLNKIALNRLIVIITTFILAVLKIIAPKKNIEEIDTPKPDKPLWKPRWRKKKDE